MTQTTIPISTLFIGLNGLLALVLSYMVVMERTQRRLWHGESQKDVAMQPNYLENPSQWALIVEKWIQKSTINESKDEGILQRKIRAHGNFIEYVPIGLLFILALELMGASSWLLWLLGGLLTLARIVYAYGVITTYGPSIGRAIGFFGTWFVYIIGSFACIYYSFQSLI